MEIVEKTKIGLFLRKHANFGTIVYSPFSGLFFAVADEFSGNLDNFCKNKENSIPQAVSKQLLIGKIKGDNFDIEHWLPSKQDFDGVLPEYPIVINWLISNKCNCNCTYCYAGDVIDKPFEETDVKESAHKILSTNPLAVVLSGGEPLVQINKLKDALNVLGDKTGIILDTNGLIFNNDIALLFKKYNVVVRVSLDSLQNKLNSKIRPFKDKNDKTNGVFTIIENIQKYKKMGITVLVHSVLSTMNKQSLEDLYTQLPLLNIDGWRVFTVARPNDNAKKGSFDKLMKYGKRKSIDEAEKQIAAEIAFFEKRFKSKANFSIQILKNTTTKQNSVVLAMPDGTLMTESMFKSEKTIVDATTIFQKVDQRSHYERYLGQI